MRHAKLTGALAAIATGLVLTAPPADAQPHCPPGQAKKGNCIGAGPPGHAKGKRHGHDRPAVVRPPEGWSERPRVVLPGSAPVVAPRPAPRPAVVNPQGDGRPAVVNPRGDRVVITPARDVPPRVPDVPLSALDGALALARYAPVADPALFGLPALGDGSRYYIAGDRIVRADPRDWRVLADIRRLDRQADCPPGLAKKEPACIPPGQVQKILGTPWDPDRYRRLDDHARYGLAAPDGAWDYYVVDGTVVRLDRSTREILSLVRVLDAVLD
ncbi:hypothetical protein GI374_10950 [Paracoccus sp. S-4012]|uniref:hypothetical protein n=1 Tax=Paracoccus sp. S-4012 TaxID=2665648 RepID=UPI0012AF25BE|nr:hypothetical protein [Paracoccus sp. S-4012]MRX50954.1 hypothetical protein [Paracoccus sp. S-4012]